MIKSCPFCGQEPQYAFRPSDHTKTGEWHTLSCFGGGCSSHAWHGGDTKDAVIESWNKRVPS